MKKVLIPALALTLVTATPVLAETNASSTKARMEENREALKDAQKKFKDAVEQKKQEIAAKKEDIKKEIEDKQEEVRGFKNGFVREASQHTVAMLNAMADRFQKLIDRTSSRIDKVKATGATTTDATVALNQAKADLAKARTQIDAVKAINLNFGTTTSTTTVKTTVDQFKAAVKAVKDTFNAVHKDLTKALSSLPHEKSEKTATTTATSTSAH